MLGGTGPVGGPVPFFVRNAIRGSNMPALFNPLHVNITYEASEEVLQTYLVFGEETDGGNAALLDDTSVANMNQWVDFFMNAMRQVVQTNWRCRGWHAGVRKPTDAGFPPARRGLVIEGTGGIPHLPNDSYYNINFTAVRPDLKAAHGGLRISGLTRAAAMGGRFTAVAIAAFNAIVLPQLNNSVVIGGIDYFIGMEGKYLDEQDEEQSYFSKVDNIFLNPVVGSRKDRIPNRSNFPKGTKFSAP